MIGSIRNNCVKRARVVTVGTTLALVLIALWILPGRCVAESRKKQPLPMCTYEMLVWNVNQGSSVVTTNIRHDRRDITAEETDPETGCTVCSEDQMMIDLPPILPFSICSKIAPQVREALENLLRRGAPVTSVVGYHVIKSRGPVDGNGNRTEFSNHSFGTAIDINPQLNGLYDNCIKFGPECRLLRGGEWHAGVAGTLEPDGEIVTALKRAGFRWGGEIEGRQKDFMHFSLTGY